MMGVGRESELKGEEESVKITQNTEVMGMGRGGMTVKWAVWAVWELTPIVTSGQSKY